MTRALRRLCFVSGGAGYIVLFGPLVAGVALVAGLEEKAARHGGAATAS